MPSATALRAILGAGLGLGAVDVVWIDVQLAPRVVVAEPAAQAAANVETLTPTPALTPTPTLTPTPEPEPVAPPAPPPERVTEHAQVFFATSSAELDADARAALDQRASADAAFVLEGHADSRGSEHRNAALSRARASAVAAYLVERGVAPAQIETRFVGEDGAGATGARWRDRRVDIDITGGPR